MQDKQAHGQLVRWLVPLAIIAFCALAIVISTTFERMPPILKRGIQPSDFPQLVAGLIILLALLSIWREPVRLTERLGPATWGTFVLMAVFVALVPVDFFLALGVFAAGLAFLWGERRPSLLATVGVMVPVLVFFLFDLAFEIRFPRGLLTNLWYG
ncbi:MAG: tripartite tricarboxylate transporter TctB family protein [Roseibium sp.]|nr:tripartite tricarboxylate transporter TctB family protein [Roseibium sp.]